jgi:hypothetical protein
MSAAKLAIIIEQGHIRRRVTAVLEAVQAFQEKRKPRFTGQRSLGRDQDEATCI